ncbi:unnamed protein product, partial [Iphiclides podalirius]
MMVKPPSSKQEWDGGAAFAVTDSLYFGNEKDMDLPARTLSQSLPCVEAVIQTSEFLKVLEGPVSLFSPGKSSDFHSLMSFHEAVTVVNGVRDKKGIALVEEFISETKEQFQNLFPDTQLMPGAKKLIEHFNKKNVPIGLATSSSEESYHLKVDKHHSSLFSLFPYKTFGSSDPEVKRGKPHPDIFLVAACKFPDNPKPDQCLVFEDAINGVKAARSAGMQVVMVPDQQMDRSLTTEATLVLDSLEDFQPELFGLPPFE